MRISSPLSQVPLLAVLLIVAGDIELNRGPFNLVSSANLAFICSIQLALAVSGDCPSLTDLRKFPVKSGFKDIVSEIKNDYEHFGILLLEDESGIEIKGIETAKHGIPVAITVEILRRWLQGKGRLPVTWWTLVECLRDAKLNVAADYIENGLSQVYKSNGPVSTDHSSGQQQQSRSSDIGMATIVVAVFVGALVIVIVLRKNHGVKSSHLEPSKAVFVRENEEVIVAKFADLQTKVCDKLFKNGVNIKHFHLFVINQFPPGDCIPQPPASLMEIFKAITYHGLWDYLHYSPLVYIVKRFGAGDLEMESWIQTYLNDLKADLECINLRPGKCAKYDPHYYCPVEWKAMFIDHSLQYLTDVWKAFSGRYLLPDSPPTALLDRVHKGCFAVTWLIPSHLITPLIKRIEVDTNFFQQHRIVKVAVGEECIYEEVAEGCTSKLQPAQESDWKGQLECGREADLDDTLETAEWEKTIMGYDCKFVEPPTSVFQTDCLICHLLLRDPYQVTCCGTNFCHSCCLRLQTGLNPCPVCKEVNFKSFLNKGLKRSLNQLHVFCTHSRYGCSWRGELGELDHHLNVVIHSNISKLQKTSRLRFTTTRSDPEEVNRNIRWHYANALKDKYRSGIPSFLTLQWPPPPTHRVFNLAMISRRTRNYGSNEEQVKLLMRGKVSDIMTSRNAVTLNQISQSMHSRGRKIVLIDGAPGAGKSTLAWYLCRMWEVGELFHEFEIVLFVQLREPAIQSAQCLEDLFPTETSMRRKAVSAIQYCCGHQVLIVLDSWDEFSPGLHRNSIIRELICNPFNLNMQFSALIITSRPIATGQLQNYVSTRIEIVGFLRTEVKNYFTEVIGDPQIVQKLSKHLQERPVIEASCYLPLNTAIVAHLFLALDHTLPTTLHGVFTSLVKCCIIRHMKMQGQTLEISSLDNLPPDIQEQFNNLCTMAYHGVRMNKATFSAADLQSFKLPTELSTLSLIQGVASFTAFGESRLYNFLHLSTQELLAAFFISTMQPKEQVKIFKDLFAHPRFSAVFQFYAAFTKLQTEGIKDTVCNVVKSKDITLLVSLLHCLYEAQDDTLCQFVASQLKELNLSEQYLSPVDCLSVGYFARGVCFTTAGEFKLKLTIDRNDEYGASLLVRELSNHCIPGETQQETPAKTGTLDLRLKLRGSKKSSAMKLICSSTLISKLDLSKNVITDFEAAALADTVRVNQNLETLMLHCNDINHEGSVTLASAIKECRQLKHLHLDENNIGKEGCIALSAALQECKELQSLSLGYNNIGTKGSVALGSALKECRKLEHLDLENNSIGDEGCIALSTALLESKELQALILNSNNIGDQGFIALGVALQECMKLQILYLYNNNLTDASIECLTGIMKTAKSLKELDLAYNHFTEKDRELQQVAEERNSYPDFVKLYLLISEESEQKQTTKEQLL